MLPLARFFGITIRRSESMQLLLRSLLGRKKQSGSWLTPSTFVCEHGPTKGWFKLKVLGIWIELKDSPMCETCTAEYLDKFSTECGGCWQPILPGESVGRAGSGAKYPWIHMKYGCGAFAGNYFGKWGEGQLIRLDKVRTLKAHWED